MPSFSDKHERTLKRFSYIGGSEKPDTECSKYQLLPLHRAMAMLGDPLE